MTLYLLSTPEKVSRFPGPTIVKGEMSTLGTVKVFLSTSVGQTNQNNTQWSYQELSNKELTIQVYDKSRLYLIELRI